MVWLQNLGNHCEASREICSAIQKSKKPRNLNQIRVIEKEPVHTAGCKFHFLWNFLVIDYYHGTTQEYMLTSNNAPVLIFFFLK